MVNTRARSRHSKSSKRRRDQNESEKWLNPAAGIYGRTLQVFKAVLGGKRSLLEGAQGEIFLQL